MKLLAVDLVADATVTEFQTSNQLLYSQDQTNAAWVKTGISVNGAPTPPGGSPPWFTVADLLVEDTSTGTHQFSQLTASLAAGTYNCNMYLAPNGRTLGNLVLLDGAVPANLAQLAIDLAAGTVTPSVGGSGISIVRSSIGADLGGGVRRLSFTVALASAITVLARMQLRNGAGSSNYTGDGASGMFVARPQLGAGPVETAPILTNAAPQDNTRWLTTLPASNVQLEGRAAVARSATSSFGNTGFVVDFAAARNVNACVAYRHNLSATATLRVVLFDGPGLTGNLLYDSGNEDASSLWSSYSWVTDTLAPKFSTLWLPATYAARSALVLLRDKANADGYIQLKRLMLGEVINPTRQVITGMGLQWVDDSQQQRTLAGSLRTDPQARYRRLTGELDALPESERAAVVEAAGYAGLSREVFVSVYPGLGGTQERDHSLLGKFTRLPQMSQAKPMYARSTFEISET
jgi:hypothetical protein